MFTERLVQPPDFCVHHIALNCIYSIMFFTMYIAVYIALDSPVHFRIQDPIPGLSCSASQLSHDW